MNFPRVPALPRLLRPRLRFPPQQRRHASSHSTRTSKILSRLPHRLQKYTHNLRNAPLSHIISFLILHEITAVVPLVSLFALFHYTSYTPVDYVTKHWSGHVRDGIARFERYFGKKGWFGFSNEDNNNNRHIQDIDTEEERETVTRKREGQYDDGIVSVRMKIQTEGQQETEGSVRRTRDLILGWEAGGEGTKYRFLADVALAWAVTKAILPLRILASVWATPWFAGVMIGARNMLRRRR